MIEKVTAAEVVKHLENQQEDILQLRSRLYWLAEMGLRIRLIGGTKRIATPDGKVPKLPYFRVLDEINMTVLGEGQDLLAAIDQARERQEAGNKGKSYDLKVEHEEVKPLAEPTWGRLGS